MLRGCLPATVSKTLETLPTSLDETYQRILLSIGEEIWECAHRLLQCLAVCVQLLTIDALAEVLAIDFDEGMPTYNESWYPVDCEGAILSVCSSLVIVQPWTRLIQFTHFSVQEYLVSKRLTLGKE